MNPKLSAGRDRGGNPFSIANAVKPSKAPITLPIGSPDIRLSLAESDAIKRQHSYLARQLVAAQDQVAKMADQLASLERLIGSKLLRAAGEVA